MRVVVDYDVCGAFGKCMKRAPDVFRLEEDDTLTVLEASPPEALRQQVEAAVQWCPKGAISLEEDDD